MKTRNLLGLLFSLVVLIMTGCGGGGGGSTAAGSPSITGVASKGPIKSGHFQAFEIFSSHNPAKSRPSATPFFSGVTDDKGNFNIPIPADMKRDGVYVKVIDGTYLDEATQTEKSLATEFPEGMRAAFGNISGVVKRGEHMRGHVTPFTEMAFRSSAVELDDDSVKLGQHEIEHAFGLDDKGVDIIHTQPLDLSAPLPAGADDHQKAYTNALGILSQYEKDNSASGKTLSGFSDDLVAEIHNNGGLLSTTTKSSLSASELTFDNSGHDTTGVVPGAVTVDVAASKLTASVTADPVTISATVKVGGVAVPGTEVKFAIKSGAGTLGERSVLTNASGVASTTLTSTTDGDIVVVTATAGGISANSTSINFSNPNKPLSIALSANPTSGTTLASGFVTLTATVSPVAATGSIADGTVVTFTVTSGSGTISAVTTTSGGVATARLSAAAAGAVTVTASATPAASSPLTVNFISQPTLAIVKVGTAGTLGTGQSIGGITASVTYPTSGLTIAAADVAGSGVGATSTLVPNANVGGTVTLGLINATGIQTGEFATLTFHVAAGTFPTLADFKIAAGATIIDANTNLALPGISATVLGLTLQ